MDNQFIKEDCIKSCKGVDQLASLTNSSILITGGTGFAGRWILEMLNYLNVAYLFNIKIYLLARNEPSNFDIKDYNNVLFLKSDVKNLKEIPSEINYIIHAAGTPDSRFHVSNPIKTIEDNYKGTQNILNLASRLPNLKKFIHFSSNKVYGLNLKPYLISESRSTFENLDVHDVYSESKRISEAISKAYIAEMNLPIIIVRPFAFVGPFQSLEKPWAINSFIRDAILGGPIRILGNEMTVKSYLYGSDLAGYIVNILSLGQVGEVYNLGSTTPITLIDLAKKIRSIVGLSNNISVSSSKDIYNDHVYDVPMMSKVGAVTNYSPSFNLEDSLDRTINWNRNVI